MAGAGDKNKDKKKWAIIAGVVVVVVLAVVIAVAVSMSGNSKKGKPRQEDAKETENEDTVEKKATVFSESLKEFLKPKNVSSPMPAKASSPFAGAAPLSPM